MERVASPLSVCTSICTCSAAICVTFGGGGGGGGKWHHKSVGDYTITTTHDQETRGVCDQDKMFKLSLLFASRSRDQDRNASKGDISEYP